MVVIRRLKIADGGPDVDIIVNVVGLVIVTLGIRSREVGDVGAVETGQLALRPRDVVRAGRHRLVGAHFEADLGSGHTGDGVAGRNGRGGVGHDGELVGGGLIHTERGVEADGGRVRAIGQEVVVGDHGVSPGLVGEAGRYGGAIER